MSEKDMKDEGWSPIFGCSFIYGCMYLLSVVCCDLFRFCAIVVAVVHT